ncbi:hypothetical protein QJQ45_005165 [Haematococcus lacustris]|nr:hypothetical protein QJQ45_005165 [Haematococcus lacustris]
MNNLLSSIVDSDDERPRGRGRQTNPTFAGGDVEMGGAGFATPLTEQELAMQQFFKEVEVIKAEMASIRQLQQEVNQMHEKGKIIVKSKEVQRHREALQEKINQVSAVAHKIKNRVEMLDKANEVAKKVKGQGEGSASERTRTTITAGLKKKLKDLMGEFSQLRNRIQDEYREVVERRVYTVTGQHVAEEEIDRMIETGEAENIFQKAILTDQVGRGRVLDTLAEIQERHRAVRDLEQSLLELHQIFLDMAVLVEAQGEMLDNIEKQVARSVEYVQSGTTALVDAKQLQKKTRKLMCCALFIVLLVALIIVLAVVQPWKLIKGLLDGQGLQCSDEYAAHWGEQVAAAGAVLWSDQGALPAKGKEYPDLGYKRVRATQGTAAAAAAAC